MESGLQLGKHASVAHALDALALVPFRHIRTDERKRHGVQTIGEHRVHIVHKFARDAVLVGSDSELKRAHHPLDRRPVQRRETRANP